MTILQAWGCDIYGTTGQFHREPNQIVLSSFGSQGHMAIETTTGRFGGGCMNFTPSSTRTAIIEYQFPDRKTIFVTFAFKIANWAATSEVFLMSYNETEHVRILSHRDKRQLQIQILGVTQDYIDFQVNVWNHMEFKLIVDDAAGELTIRLNGVQVFSQTGVDTQNGSNAFCNRIQFRANDPIGQSPDNRVDDLIINDDQGAVNNTWMGDVEIQTLRPTADTATVDFTRSAGATNFENVDDNPGPDDDTTYVESSTVAHQDLYDMGSLKTQSSTVAALITRAYIQKTDAGSRFIKMLSFENATLGTGATKTMSSTYSYVNEIFELNPDTSLLWTVTQINAAQIGMENV